METPGISPYVETVPMPGDTERVQLAISEAKRRVDICIVGIHWGVPIGWVTPRLGSLGLFALAGCISVSALMCVNRSLKLAPASVVVPYQYSMIVWAVMFGYVVFGDVPQASTVAGAAVIIGAGFYIFLREQQLGRGESVVSPPV